MQLNFGGINGAMSWISRANNYNIKVHIWFDSCNNGKWVYNSRQQIGLNRYIKVVQSYVKISWVSGILFGEMKYPGNSLLSYEETQGIVQAEKLVVASIHQINSNCVVSIKLTPESNLSEIYYQRFYDAASKYFDFVVPYVYKGNVKENVSTVSNTVDWYVKNSKGASV